MGRGNSREKGGGNQRRDAHAEVLEEVIDGFLLQKGGTYDERTQGGRSRGDTSVPSHLSTPGLQRASRGGLQIESPKRLKRGRTVSCGRSATCISGRVFQSLFMISSTCRGTG